MYIEYTLTLPAQIYSVQLKFGNLANCNLGKCLESIRTWNTELKAIQQAVNGQWKTKVGKYIAFKWKAVTQRYSFASIWKIVEKFKKLKVLAIKVYVMWTSFFI